MTDLQAALKAHEERDPLAYALVGDALEGAGHPLAAERRRLQAMLASKNAVRAFFARPALDLLVETIHEEAQPATPPDALAELPF